MEFADNTKTSLLPRERHGACTPRGMLACAACMCSVFLLAAARSVWVSASLVTCRPEVWVVRHGDKAPEGGLSARGFARADWLRDLVLNGTWPRFHEVYATDPRELTAVNQPMVREWQTARPMAAALGIAVNVSFSKDASAALAEAALTAARAACAPVLIVWEHCRIPAVLAALGCADERCARCWDDGKFEEVVRLDVRSAPPALQVGTEGFGKDHELGFAAFECVGTRGNAACGRHCPCQLPNGTWL